MVRIDCASSLPPHIQPPIAPVPSPIRGMVIGWDNCSISIRGRAAWLVMAGLLLADVISAT